MSIISLLVWVACAVAAGLIGSRKGRPVLGAVLGVLLSIIGVIIIALVPAKRIY